MDEKTLLDIKNQHVNNYKKALIETIQNNTNALVNDDLISLFCKPPLDSMDIVKNKMISFAKKYKFVLDASKLDNMLDSYRKNIVTCCEKIKKMRIDYFSDIVDKFKDDDVIVFYKKDFNSLNKKIKKSLKEQVVLSIDNKLLKDINKIISTNADNTNVDSFIEEITKFLKKQYLKQVMDSFDIKFLVKDTTLMNSVKEQGDRYLFTLKNSRLLNDFD